jgi:hypothetical protein
VIPTMLPCMIERQTNFTIAMGVKLSLRTKQSLSGLKGELNPSRARRENG